MGARRLRVLALTASVTMLALTGCAPQQSAPDASCGGDALQIGPTVEQLERALDSAHPGDTLQLADTVYRGNIVLTSSGTADAPITLCGSRGARIDGGTNGYALHLDGASHWRLTGFSIHGGAKGVVLDRANDNVLHGLEVSGTAEEGIHLRTGSSRNTISASHVHDTGRGNPEYGEGIYIGSAERNWCTYTDCEPDTSDDNRILDNTVSETRAEAIDVKEGTSGGLIRGNILSLGIDPIADAVVDIKGNDWVLEGNRITGRVQIFAILAGWGQRNVIARNSFELGDDMTAVEIEGAARQRGNMVGCDNRTRGGAAIRSTVACVDFAETE